MADEKEKSIEIGQDLKPQEPQAEDELSESDVEKVSGGFFTASTVCLHPPKE